MSITLGGYTLNKPVAGPAVAAGSIAGGLTPSGVYQYVVTFLTGFGESEPNSTPTSYTATSTGSAILTGIPVATANVSGRRVYRTVAGGTAPLLLVEILDNTTVGYIDIKADGALGAAVPTVSTASSLQQVDGNFKVSRPSLLSLERAITAGAGGTTTTAYQLTAEYSIISTVTTVNDGVKLPGLTAQRVGAHVKIRNNSSNAARIFPFNGQTINGGSADAPVVLAATTTTEFIADLASNWQQL